MASPAQVANDMVARAVYWRGRDARVHNVCHDAACVIRCHLNGEPLFGETYRGVRDRLMRLEAETSNWTDNTQIREALTRARQTLEELTPNEVRHAQA